MKQLIPILFAILIVQSCAVKHGHSYSTSVPSAPDYSLPNNWAALPEKIDMADQVPKGVLVTPQEDAQADVFFIHPTTYTGKADNWNASVEDVKLNEKTDETTILYQASIFNASGKVYAPRYRQAHLSTFRSEDKAAATQALQLAYQDVKRAFQYYLDHYNDKRPIIIAAHNFLMVRICSAVLSWLMW